MKQKGLRKRLRTVGGIVFWGMLVLICFLFRDRISVDAIVNFSPNQPLLAVGIMLLLFSVKSLLFVIYGGILYAACGIMFSLPVAIAVNLAGTVLMTSIPFFVGRLAGRGFLSRLTDRYPKLEVLRQIPRKNPFFVSFFVRMIGLLPADGVGMYLGAGRMPYGPYLAGTLLGLLPSVVAFSVMGMSADDPTSPAFRISLGFEIGLTVFALLLYLIRKKRKKGNE